MRDKFRTHTWPWRHGDVKELHACGRKQQCLAWMQAMPQCIDAPGPRAKLRDAACAAKRASASPVAVAALGVPVAGLKAAAAESAAAGVAPDVLPLMDDAVPAEGAGPASAAVVRAPTPVRVGGAPLVVAAAGSTAAVSTRWLVSRVTPRSPRVTPWAEESSCTVSCCSGARAATSTVTDGSSTAATGAVAMPMLETSIPSCATASAAGDDDDDKDDACFLPVLPAIPEPGMIAAPASGLAESSRKRVPAGSGAAPAAASAEAFGSLAAAATDAMVECWQQATSTLRHDDAAAELAFFRFRSPRLLPPVEVAAECWAHTVSVKVPPHLRPSGQRASARSPTTSAGQQRQKASSHGVCVQPAQEQHQTATSAERTTTAAVPPMPPPTAAAHLDVGSTTFPSLPSAVGVALGDGSAVLLTVTGTIQSSGLKDGDADVDGEVDGDGEIDEEPVGEEERLGLRELVGVEVRVRVGVADAGGQPPPPHPGTTLSLGEGSCANAPESDKKATNATINTRIVPKIAR